MRKAKPKKQKTIRQIIRQAKKDFAALKARPLGLVTESPLKKKPYVKPASMKPVKLMFKLTSLHKRVAYRRTPRKPKRSKGVLPMTPREAVMQRWAGHVKVADVKKQRRQKAEDKRMERNVEIKRMIEVSQVPMATIAKAAGMLKGTLNNKVKGNHRCRFTVGEMDQVEKYLVDTALGVLGITRGDLAKIRKTAHVVAQVLANEDDLG